MIKSTNSILKNRKEKKIITLLSLKAQFSLENVHFTKNIDILVRNLWTPLYFSCSDNRRFNPQLLLSLGTGTTFLIQGLVQIQGPVLLKKDTQKK